MPKEFYRPKQVEMALCVNCERCYTVCPSKSISYKGTQRFIDYKKCRGCLACVTVCPRNAISVDSFKEDDILSVDVIAEKCSGCGTCFQNCPQGLFQEVQYINKEKKSKKVFIVPTSKYYLCQGCEVCVENCPEKAISIQKFKPEKK
jgi:ferredoxin